MIAPIAPVLDCTTYKKIMEKIIDTQTANFIARTIKENDEERTLQMYEYKGVYFSDANVEKTTLDYMPTWEARREDVFVVSYPKSGTTWTQEIIYLALNGGDDEKANQSHTWTRIPYLESKLHLPEMQWFRHPWRSLLVLLCLMKVVLRMPWKIISFAISEKCLKSTRLYQIVKILPSPRFFKTHLPSHLIPQDVFNKKSKIVYIARNPKDLAVSYYYFCRWQPMMPKFETWDEFFDAFMEGKVSYGKWYDHYLGYWRRRQGENILFLKYEDMKKDDRSAVKQICEFLGYNYSDEILDRITQRSRFDSMKNNPRSNPDALNMHRESERHISFMRKGIVGDWKNHFTAEQTKAFDALYKEKLAGTGLDFEFE